jgi:hypothetical protein
LQESGGRRLFPSEVLRFACGLRTRWLLLNSCHAETCLPPTTTHPLIFNNMNRGYQKHVLSHDLSQVLSWQLFLSIVHSTIRGAR